MKRFTLLGLALMAVLSLGASLAASSSFALPELLPIAGNSTFTGRNVGTAKVVLETVGKSTVECASATSTGAQETDTLGTFHISFKTCASTGFIRATCTSRGDASGEILTLGSFHYVYDTLGGTEKVAILFLPKPTEFECSIVKVKVTGTLVCLILKPLESNVTHQFHCVQKEGKQTGTRWWNDAGTAQTAQLLTETNNSGRPEESGELALAEVTFARAVSFEND